MKYMNIFSACIYQDTGSDKGTKIGKTKLGWDIEYQKHIETISDCQSECRKYKNDTTDYDACNYFTYYNKTCILRKSNTKWSLIYNLGRTTGTRECSQGTETSKWKNNDELLLAVLLLYKISCYC